MNNKKAKALRKQTQYTDRQTKEIFNLVMDRQLTMHFKERWKVALRILRGNESRKVNLILIGMIVLSLVINTATNILMNLYYF